MTQVNSQHRKMQQWLSAALLTITLLATVGCEMDSYFDPSVVGRWEYTPVKLPILDRLDVIDEPDPQPAGLSQVQPEDLVYDAREYVITNGDIISVSIFELVEINREWVQGRRVDEMGLIRLPYIGEIQAAGKSASEVEQLISDRLEEEGILRDATVTVFISDRLGQFYSVITEPRQSGTVSGPYPMEKPNFTLLEALARARGVDGQIDRIYVIRSVPLDVKGGQTPGPGKPAGQEVPDTEPSDLIEDLFKGVDSNGAGARADEPLPSLQAPPAALDTALDRQAKKPAGQWKYEDGQWILDEQAQEDVQQPQDNGQQKPVVAQRVIEIPLRKLLDGELEYNIIIRPGDVIRIPSRTSGVCYVSGAVNRPSVYTVPGEKEMTLMNLIGGPAGGINAVGIPEKVDLIRRIDRDQVAIVRLNLRAIYEGTQPDIFIKPNDQINVGQTFWSFPLAVFRNGLRMTYGFGFVLDKNFSTDVFGSPAPSSVQNVTNNF